MSSVKILTKEDKLMWEKKKVLVSFLWEIRMQIKVEVICKFSSQT